ncbi:hypothetical protein C2845_PM09G12880 [Panicum miliaceum]|uniref:Uncharacterized protein n=1 Tax=Panicum miliaceum TaxID=4540 RepID=A0A3L6S2P0_PANMI|nr:hypothetical protein C2845_PM09G12880 [Panicum miliaceum]
MAASADYIRAMYDLRREREDEMEILQTIVAQAWEHRQAWDVERCVYESRIQNITEQAEGNARHQGNRIQTLQSDVDSLATAYARTRNAVLDADAERRESRLHFEQTHRQLEQERLHQLDEILGLRVALEEAQEMLQAQAAAHPVQALPPNQQDEEVDIVGNVDEVMVDPEVLDLLAHENLFEDFEVEENLGGAVLLPGFNAQFDPEPEPNFHGGGGWISESDDSDEEEEEPIEIQGESGATALSPSYHAHSPPHPIESGAENSVNNIGNVDPENEVMSRR